MVLGGGDDDGGLTDAGLCQFVDGGEDGDIPAGFRQETPGAAGVWFGQGDELTGLRIARQLVYVESVDGAHTAEACNRYFEGFTHEKFKNTMGKRYMPSIPYSCRAVVRTAEPGSD